MSKIMKRIFSMAIAVIIVVSMAVVGISVNAAVMPYHIDTDKTATFTIHKFEMPDVSAATFGGTGEASDFEHIPEGATPLANVEFSLYKIANLDTYFTTEGVKLPTVEEAQKLIESGKTKEGESIQRYIGVTDKDGVYKFKDLPLAIYYVAETNGPAQITKPIAPFVTSLPITNVDGTKWIYDVEAFPKNETAYGTVVLKKLDSTTGNTLPGAEFTLYTSNDGETYKPYMEKIVTGEDGTATIENLPSQTFYKFVETKTSDPAYILDSTVGYEFYIDGTGDAIVDGKVLENNTIVVGNEKPSIEKWVLESQHGTKGIDTTADFNEAVYWEIDSTIPSNVAKLATYTIVDKMSKGIEYTGNEIIISGVNEDGKELTKTLEEGTDYKVTQKGLEVTFTFLPANLDGYSDLTLYFNTKLTEEAPLAVDIPNQAKLIYTNDIGTDSTYEPVTQIPTVHTGGYSFLKTDEEKNPLSGVTFAIYSSENDAKNNTNAIMTVESDEDGIVSFKGLKYGAFSLNEEGKAINGVDAGSTNYWISEIKTVDGYTLLSAPFEVNVNHKSHIPSSNEPIVNNKTPDFPQTGAAGTFGLFALAFCLIGAGVAFFVVSSKKRNEDHTT